MRITEYRLETPNILAVEKKINYPAADRITDLPQMVSMMKDVYGLHRLAEEYVYMVAVNTKGKALGVFNISHGLVNVSLIGAREVYMRALLIGACSIFVCHNHPSGDPSPSKEDITVTEKLKKAGEMIGVMLLDHIIIADGGYYSFRESESCLI